MADNRVAYGLAKKYGIDTTGMTPKQVWDALKDKGVSQESYNKEQGKKKQQAEKIYNTDVPTPAENERLREMGIKDKPRENLSAEERRLKELGIEDEPKLAVSGQGARNLYKEIKSGKRFSYEELLENPVIQEFERKAQKAQQLAEKKPPMSDKEKAQYGDKFLKGANSTPKQYRADIVMGLPAAGKSSAVVNSLKEKYGSFEFDNDEIKKLLQGYNEYGAAYVHEDSQAVQNYAFSAFKKGGTLNGANLAIPIIGSKVSSVGDKWIKPLREAGYDIHIHHVGISNEESMNRMVGRAIKTGRYIPLERIDSYGEKPKEVYEQLKKEERKEVTFE